MSATLLHHELGHDPGVSRHAIFTLLEVPIWHF